tara:strand:+ start:3575 stop:3907 length:333 start_codon:yes stop_codon:yes gene_type:complete
MKDVHELPKDIKEFLVREIPNFRKYNPSTLPSGKDIWDLYEDYVKELWYWYKEYQRSEQPTQYDNACEMAGMGRQWAIMCDSCKDNLEIVYKADEVLFCSSEDFYSEYSD